MSESNFESLLIENQICFPLYVCAKEWIKVYTPYLDELGLTYTQFITMMVLWEQKSLTVKELGKSLFLDSGTLTPVLKTLEQQQLITRERSKQDERVLLVKATAKGVALREEALAQQPDMALNTGLSAEEEAQLAALLGKMLAHEQK